MKKVIFIIALCFCFGPSGFAQDECILKLKAAQKNYEEGNIETIPGLLSGCMEDGLKKEDKVTALKLLVNVHLFEDDMIKAEEAMVDLLTFEPEYEINELIDPIEFIDLYNTYRTDPAYSIGVIGGLNYSQISVIRDYGTPNTNDYKGTYLSPVVGNQLGLKASMYLFKGGNINLEAVYFTRKFNFATTLSGEGFLESQEKESFLYLPLSFTYEKVFGKFIPYARIGGSMEITLAADAEMTRSYTDNSHNNVTGPEYNITAQRNRWNYSLVGGLGFKYKVNRGNVFVDVRYNLGLTNQAKAENRFNNPTLLYQYHYVSDDFKANNLVMSIGYMRSFYNPKKNKVKS